MKKIFFGVLVFCFVSSFTFFIMSEDASAEEIYNISKTVGEGNMSLDLFDNEMVSDSYLNEEGEEVEVQVENMGDVIDTSRPLLKASRSLSTGTKKYKISYNSGVINVWFYVNVKYANGKSTITKAYDGNYKVFGTYVKSDVLTRDSSTQATYKFKFVTFGISHSGYLRAKVGGSKLIISHD